MKLSIGRAMIGIALLAIAFSVVSQETRDRKIHRAAHDLIVGVLPMATVLIYGLCGAGLDLAAGRPTNRYLVGFQAGGWAAIFAYRSGCTCTFEWRDRPMRLVGEATSWVLSHGFAFDDPAIMTAHMACFLVPQLIVAAIGGWIGARFGVILTRQNRVAAEVSGGE